MYTAYTDGGCAYNPGGAGGCACIIISDEGERRLSEGYASTTNNRMEISAVILALKNIPEGEQVRIFSDSQYVINCATGRWSKEKNADLWRMLDSLAKKRSVSYRIRRRAPGFSHGDIRRIFSCSQLMPRDASTSSYNML